MNLDSVKTTFPKRVLLDLQSGEKRNSQAFEDLTDHDTPSKRTPEHDNGSQGQSRSIRESSQPNQPSISKSGSRLGVLELLNPSDESARSSILAAARHVSLAPTYFQALQPGPSSGQDGPSSKHAKRKFSYTVSEDCTDDSTAHRKAKFLALKRDCGPKFHSLDRRG